MEAKRQWPEGTKSAVLPPSLQKEAADRYMATPAVQRIIDRDHDGASAYLALINAHQERGEPTFLMHRRDKGPHIVARSFANETRPLIMTESESEELFGEHPTEETSRRRRRTYTIGQGIGQVGVSISEAAIVIALILVIAAQCEPRLIPW